MDISAFPKQTKTGDSVEPAEELTAAEANQFLDEISNAIGTSGQTGDAGNVKQLAEAMARYASGGVYFADSSTTANSHVLTVPSGVDGFVVPEAYFQGMMVIFRPGATNTGPATINVNNIGVKPVLTETGTALAGGELVAGKLTTLECNIVSGNVTFRLAPWANAKNLGPFTGGSGGDFREGFVNQLTNEGRFFDIAASSSPYAGAFVAPDDLLPYNGAVFSDGGKFVWDNSTFGGSGAALSADIEALANKIIGSATYRRFSPEFYALQVTAGTGTAVGISVGSQTYYRSLYGRLIPLFLETSAGFNIRVVSGSVALQKTGDMYIDGVLQSGHVSIGNVDGWKQVVRKKTGADISTYNNALHSVHATPGTVFLIGLPFLVSGNYQPKPGEFVNYVPGADSYKSTPAPTPAPSTLSITRAESALLTLANGGTHSFAHGLGDTPTAGHYGADFECVSTDAGYAAGSRIPIGLIRSNHNNVEGGISGSDQFKVRYQDTPVLRAHSTAVFVILPAFQSIYVSGSGYVQILMVGGKNLNTGKWKLRLWAEALS